VLEVKVVMVLSVVEVVVEGPEVTQLLELVVVVVTDSLL
jgi:hypothetical protein